ncbi:MAG: 2-amino-4-hydroxy-6-hydroxymethyldihydropteridine diphosphokinase [Bacillaceae bacterium]|nr:2-amino-4-hydroxy-6-hydroxymethyldihydropteridine diphosphokinase [Bacillaceae bacterium]
MEISILGLGSNLGDRLHYLTEGIRLLQEHQQIQVSDWSSVYETDPVGYTDQPPFLNMVVRIRTSLPPIQLLAAIQDIERQLGRTREVRWGPRTLDIDILLYGTMIYQDGELTIPHPRMKERAFVIVPLSEIAGHQVLPGTIETPLILLNKLKNKDGVRLWKRIEWGTVFGHIEN